ncbi:MAG: hypothetical protein K1W35_14170 [Lachnospiraceae bacterium]
MILGLLTFSMAILTTDESCREHRANRSRVAAYFLSEKLSYRIFRIVVVRIKLY